jgi:hypothetical protein
MSINCDDLQKYFFMWDVYRGFFLKNLAAKDTLRRPPLRMNRHAAISLVRRTNVPFVNVGSRLSTFVNDPCKFFK